MIASSGEQTELLRLLVQGGNRQRGRQEQGGPATTYGDFLATHPPVFSDAEEPVEAENWLRVIVSKFGLLQCTEVQKPVHGTTAEERCQCLVDQLSGACARDSPSYLG